MTSHAFYAAQGVYTDPGRYASRLDHVPDDLRAIRETARQLIFHYGIGGDYAENHIDVSRRNEIDTRYADRMFGRIFELADQPPTSPRRPNQRLLGCCRDFTVLFLAIARHKGFAARARFGFATYFTAGWYLDHVIAEVWDGTRTCWRRVDCMVEEGHRDELSQSVIDPLDVPADRFLAGAQAWSGCRRGLFDVDRFAVDPGFAVPATRGWRYVRHNLIHDLAGLNKAEMLLWDSWGLTDLDGDLGQDQLALLDEAAAAMSMTGCELGNVRALYDRVEFRVPDVVKSFSPAHPEPLYVRLRREYASSE
jgi:hypothetical protein